MPASRQALALMQDEEQGGVGIATVLCSGAKLTKAGAAFVNAEMILAGGKWDTFRMLAHPALRSSLPHWQQQNSPALPDSSSSPRLLQPTR